MNKSTALSGTDWNNCNLVIIIRIWFVNKLLWIFFTAQNWHKTIIPKNLTILLNIVSLINQTRKLYPYQEDFPFHLFQFSLLLFVLFISFYRTLGALLHLLKSSLGTGEWLSSLRVIFVINAIRLWIVFFFFLLSSKHTKQAFWQCPMHSQMLVFFSVASWQLLSVFFVRIVSGFWWVDNKFALVKLSFGHLYWSFFLLSATVANLKGTCIRSSNFYGVTRVAINCCGKRHVNKLIKHLLTHTRDCKLQKMGSDRIHYENSYYNAMFCFLSLTERHLLRANRIT